MVDGALPRVGNRPDILLVLFVVRLRLGKRLLEAGNEACANATETPLVQVVIEVELAPPKRPDELLGSFCVLIDSAKIPGALPKRPDELLGSFCISIDSAKTLLDLPKKGFVEVLKPAGRPNQGLLVGGSSVPPVVPEDVAEAPGSGMPEDAVVYPRSPKRIPEVLPAVSPNTPPEVVGCSADSTDG
jgi:hypothetical protein